MEKKTLGVRMFTLKNDNNDSEIEQGDKLSYTPRLLQHYRSYIAQKSGMGNTTNFNKR